VALDLLAVRSDDIRSDPSTPAKAGDGILYNEYIEEEIGAAMFERACKFGLEGIVFVFGPQNRKAGSSFLPSRRSVWIVPVVRARAVAAAAVIRPRRCGTERSGTNRRRTVAIAAVTVTAIASVTATIAAPVTVTTAVAAAITSRDTTALETSRAHAAAVETTSAHAASASAAATGERIIKIDGGKQQQDSGGPCHENSMRH
jgi:hypothetical protein